MTDRDFSELAAAVKEATPGPWERKSRSAHEVIFSASTGASVASILRTSDVAKTDADARFIALSRRDVPALIEEVQRISALRASPCVPTEKGGGPVVDVDELRTVIHSATHQVLPFAEVEMKPFSVKERAGMQVEIADLITANIGRAVSIVLSKSAPDAITPDTTPGDEGLKGRSEARDLVALSASDRACYEYPGADEQALRAAFVHGATLYASPIPSPDREEIARLRRIVLAVADAPTGGKLPGAMFAAVSNAQAYAAEQNADQIITRLRGENA